MLVLIQFAIFNAAVAERRLLETVMLTKWNEILTYWTMICNVSNGREGIGLMLGYHCWYSFELYVIYSYRAKVRIIGADFCVPKWPGSVSRVSSLNMRTTCAGIKPHTMNLSRTFETFNSIFRMSTTYSCDAGRFARIIFLFLFVAFKQQVNLIVVTFSSPAIAHQMRSARECGHIKTAKYVYQRIISRVQVQAWCDHELDWNSSQLRGALIVVHLLQFSRI